MKWCIAGDFERYLGAEGFRGDLLDPDATFELSASRAAELIGPPARVEDTDGLGPLHLWLSTDPFVAMLSSLPRAPAPYVQLHLQPDPRSTAELLAHVAALPDAARRQLNYLRGSGPWAVLQLSRYGFEVPLFRGERNDAEQVLATAGAWDVRLLRLGDWSEAPKSLSWRVERKVGGDSWVAWARYGDRLDTYFVAARASKAEAADQRVCVEPTEEIVAVFRGGRIFRV